MKNAKIRKYNDLDCYFRCSVMEISRSLHKMCIMGWTTKTMHNKKEKNNPNNKLHTINGNIKFPCHINWFSNHDLNEPLLYFVQCTVHISQRKLGSGSTSVCNRTVYLERKVQESSVRFTVLHLRSRNNLQRKNHKLGFS